MNIKYLSVLPAALFLAACSSISADKTAQAGAAAEQVSCQKISKEICKEIGNRIRKETKKHRSEKLRGLYEYKKWNN